MTTASNSRAAFWQIAALVIRDAELVARDHRVGLERGGPGQRGNRLCPLALACARHAEVQLRDRQVWLVADDALERRDSDAVGAVFNGDDRGMQRVRQRNAIFRIDPADCGRTTRPADVSERRQPLGDFGRDRGR